VSEPPVNPSNVAAARPASTGDLAALNDELVALVRAGIPLEAGLASLADSPGRLGELAEETRARLERGESLAEAVPVRDDAVGASYRAVVAAGVRSGRLAEGLEAFARVGRAIDDFRRRLLLALVYPLIVLSLAYVFLLWFLTTMLPRWERMYAGFGMELPPLARFGAWLGDRVATWWFVGPGLLVLFVLATWYSGRRGRLGPLALIPFTARSLWEFRVATFCDLLSLLVRQGVPLPEALSLAGRAAGDGWIAAEADRLAADVQGGGGFADQLRTASVLPAFARWMLAAGDRDGGLAAAAAQTATVYRRRAVRLVTWIQTLVPIVLTVVVGGSAVLFYALLLWLPFTGLMNGLS
jgi:type II secretory pathway component PulF